MPRSFINSFFSKAALVGVCTLSLANMSQAMADDKVFNDKERAAIENIVREYLISHPEVLVETAKSLEKQQNAAIEENMQEAIAYFLHDDFVPYSGDKKAPHYIIEFFDYNCGYCKVVRQHTKRLAKENDIRTIYVEFPILSPMSVRASAIGLALFSKDKNKYLKYQDYLMSKSSRINSDNDIKEAVKHVGANYDELNDIVNNNPKIQNALRTNMEIGQKIGVQGTPFFIIDNNVLRGAVKDYETFKAQLSDEPVVVPEPKK